MHPLFGDFSGFASLVAAVVLNALWQDVALVAVVWPLLRFWPGLNAATRYTIWSVVLAAAVILPVATTLTFASDSQSTAHSTSTSVARRARLSTRVPSATRTTPSAPSLRVRAAASPHLPLRPRVTLPLSLVVVIFGAWLVLALFSLARLVVGIVQLERLKRDALPLPVEYRDAMSRWTQANKGSREVRLCVSDDTDVPVAVGLFDAMILIPRVFLASLSATEIDQISLHELAHLRRADDWGNGLQRILIALLAWNPAALFIAQQLDLEREVACDDWALSLIGAVRPYALTLTKMAETSSWPRHTIPAPGVFATRKHISLRIERLLRVGRNIATGLSPAPTAAGLALVGVIALGIAIVAPSIAAPTAPAIAGVSKPSPAAIATTHAAIAVTSTPPLISRDLTKSSARTRISAEASTARSAVREAQQAVAAANLPAVIGAASSTGARSGQSLLVADFAGVDWSGRDLHGVNYTVVDLSHAKLVGTNFANSRLMEVDFKNSDLRNANFANAHLTGVDFSSAHVAGANFTNTTLEGCDFRGVDTTHIDLSQAHMIGTDFSKAASPP